MASRVTAGGFALLAAISVVVAGAGASNVPTAKAKLLHAFTGAPDGELPFAGSLVFDGAGNLYGTTPLGGTGSCSWRHAVIGCGTVYELTPAPGGDWTEHVLYSFKNFTDGMQPYGTVTLGAAGNIYGVTTAGGVRGQGCVPPFFGLRGCGTAFELTPHPGGAWTKRTLHVFSGGKDGGLPESNLVADAAGNLYGSLYCGGGIDSCYGEDDLGGAFFELEPAKNGGWTETILYAFTVKAGQGCCPLGNLTADRSGTIYGTTAFSAYTMTRLPHSLRWAQHTLFQFGSFAGGWYPQGGLAVDAAGNVYGTTYDGGDAACPHEGCGVVFELTRAPSSGAWSETVLHTFTGGADGALPYDAGLAIDSAGRLYGTTSNGGDLSCNNGGGCGVVFRLEPGAPSWRETVVHTFEDDATDGGMPTSTVTIGPAGRLFGATTYGGPDAPYGGGTVFEL
jgi:hypothetical protein